MMFAAKALAWFGGRSLLTKLLTYAAIALGAAGAFYAWKQSIYNEGYDAAMEDVRAANKEATDNAREAIDRVRACRERGGVWQSTTGKCDRGL